MSTDEDSLRLQLCQSEYERGKLAGQLEILEWHARRAVETFTPGIYRTVDDLKQTLDQLSALRTPPTPG